MNSGEQHQDDLIGPASESFPVNIPNAFCAIRAAGSLGLVALAILDRQTLFVALFLLLAFTDWIDGRLAAWLGQRTTLGARFDSVADAAMYGGLLFGCVWFKTDELLTEGAWIMAALITYALSCAVAVAKFRRMPSHHTYSAKVAAVVTVIAALTLLAGWANWPLRAATVAVSCANLESASITLLSDRWKADVPTIWHAFFKRGPQRPDAGGQQCTKRI
jgi:CDP-diacylglycerol--glycerol-3-phosphate 3-phosphatidyltransferase